MADRDDKLTIERVAESMGITPEEYKKKVIMENAERIGISIEVFVERLGMVESMIKRNN